MSDTAARLLNLLSLLQTPREWPGAELAARLRVSRRSVRRDVERLRGLGYPVRATMGPAGGYRLVAGTALPPLLLDDEEAVAIAVGLGTAAGHAVEGIEEAAVRALAKLVPVLPSRLRARVRALGGATTPLAVGDWPTVDPEVLAVLAGAISGRERLRFGYRAADGTEGRRLVEPQRLVSAGRRWYLVAYDTGRGDWRFFRVDRIRRLLRTGGRFAARELPDGDVAAFVTRTIQDMAPTYRAVATLHAPAAQVARRLGGAAGQIEPLDEHRCRLHSPADTLAWLAFRLALPGCEFEVHQPPELAAYLRALGARLLRAAGPPAERPPAERPPAERRVGGDTA
jgi:predicted DNA-binding transcriptional regulator YafY